MAPNADMIEGFTKAMHILGERTREYKSQKVQGREKWGIKSIAFGKTLGPGSKVII